MKINPFLLPLLLSLALLAAPAVFAGSRVVVDFTSIVDHPTNNTVFSSPYFEDGIAVVATGGFVMQARNDTYGGTRKSAGALGNASIYFSVAGGGTFDMVSLRLRTRNGSATFGSIDFVGTKPNGTTVTHTGAYGTNPNGNVSTFPTSFQGLSTFQIVYSFNNHYQFDDITVDLPDPVSGTPSGTFSEAQGSIPVGLQLTVPQTTPVTVNYTLVDGTATAGTDYTLPGGSATGSLTVPPGALSASVLVPILNDTAVESPETFSITYSNLVGGYFSTAANTSTITIGSDDGVGNFNSWMTAHGVTGNAALPYADANGDGISNIESWLYRLNPAGSSPAEWLERRAVLYNPTSGSPGLRFTLPLPVPADVRVYFEEATDPTAPWNEQARRAGFGQGSLWTGSGASRITESTTLSARTFTLTGSASRSARPRAFYRLKYELISNGSD